MLYFALPFSQVQITLKRVQNTTKRGRKALTSPPQLYPHTLPHSLT